MKITMFCQFTCDQYAAVGGGVSSWWLWGFAGLLWRHSPLFWREIRFHLRTTPPSATLPWRYWCRPSSNRRLSCTPTEKQQKIIRKAGRRGPAGLCTSIILGGSRFESCRRQVPLIQFFLARRIWKVEALFKKSFLCGAIYHRVLTLISGIELK